MTRSRFAPAAFIFASLLFGVAAALPALKGGELNTTLFVIAIVFLIIGGITAAKARGAGEGPPAI